MRKLIFIIAFLITSFAFAQGGPKVDVVKFRGEVSTAVRNGFTVPANEYWLIYNTTTDLMEIGSSSGWASVGDGIQEGSNTITSGIGLYESITNSMEIIPASEGLFGGQPVIRIIGGAQGNEIYYIMTNDRVSWTFGNSLEEYRINPAGETDPNDLVRKSYVDANIGGGGSIGGSIADNQIAVGGATANEIEGSNDFWWNGSNLGIGTNDPKNPIHILTPASVSSLVNPVDRGFAVTDRFGPRLLLEDSGETADNKTMVLRNENGAFSINALNDTGSAWINENLLTVDRTGNTTQKGSNTATEFIGGGSGLTGVNTNWASSVDSSIIPDTDSAYSLGTPTFRFANSYFSNIGVNSLDSFSLNTAETLSFVDTSYVPGSVVNGLLWYDFPNGTLKIGDGGTYKSFLLEGDVTGSDSGQGVSYVTLNTAITTLTNSNITASGTTNAKRVINLVTVNDTITIPTGLTKNQPFHIELEGADSTYIKPALGVNFRIVDSVSTISGDGLILKGGSKGITAVIRSDETVKFYGELGVHNEAVASGQFDNAVDPVNEVNGVANITTENGTATSSVDFAQNGTYSAKFVADGVSTGRMFHQTSGITNGDSVTFSMWLYRDSTTDPSSNIFMGALNSDGWTTSSLLTVSNATVNSWVQVTGTVTANINNPTFRSYATTISANNVWYIDNLTYTIN